MYYVESELEFVISKLQFDSWTVVNRVEMTDRVYHGLHTLIREKLMPYQMTWLHYVRLFTKGFNLKTTSPNEALHWMMKSGVSALNPTLSLAKASAYMMNKSEYKEGLRWKEMAQQLIRSKNYSNLPFSEYFTKHAELLSMVQYDKSFYFKGFRDGENIWRVFVLDKEDEEDLKVPETDEDGNELDPSLFVQSISKFVRVRTVEMIDDEYLHCSCGWQSRMMMPCRHIFRVVQRRHPDMYSVRWLSYFQYYYQKDASYTKVFDEQIRDEHNRGFKQDIKVKGLNVKEDWKFPDGELICCGINTLPKDVESAKFILSLQDRGYLFVKNVGFVSADNKTLAQYDNMYTDTRGRDSSSLPEDAHVGITTKIPEDIRRLLNKDVTSSPLKRPKLSSDEIALQIKQIQYNQNNSNVSAYQQALPHFSDLMKEAENHKGAVANICNWMMQEKARLKIARISGNLGVTPELDVVKKLDFESKIYSQRPDDEDEVISLPDFEDDNDNVVEDNAGISKERSAKRTKHFSERL
jgi:hypothetical protein